MLPECGRPAGGFSGLMRCCLGRIRNEHNVEKPPDAFAGGSINHCPVFITVQLRVHSFWILALGGLSTKRRFIVCASG